MSDTESDSDRSDGTPKIYDSYDVGEVIGRGGFGEIRRCQPKKGTRGTVYAVKVMDRQSGAYQSLSAACDPEDEICITQSLDHDSIIRTIESFDAGGILYVVMELAQGGDLAAAIKNPEVEVDEPGVGNVARQVLDALGYIHGRDIVHRDIKLENILMVEAPSKNGIRGHVKLIDFGLAERLQGRICCIGPDTSQLTLTCGTPVYFAPEMWTSGAPQAWKNRYAPQNWKERYGSTYGPKVDVFALGVMSYVIIFGKFPYAGGPTDEDLARLMKACCSEDENPSFEFSKKGVSCKPSKRCRDLIAQLLQKDSRRRPEAQQALKHSWFSAKTRALGLLPYQVRSSVQDEIQQARRMQAIWLDGKPHCY